MSTPRVRDFMSKEVIAIEEGTSIDTAIWLFKTERISGAPVIDEARRPIGVVSLRDLLEVAPNDDGIGHRRYHRIRAGHVVVHDDSSEGGRGPVERLMTREVRTVEAALPITEAAQRMVKLGIHRFVVVDEGLLVGMISSLDLLRGLLPRG
ncbi:MAG: CBS domain-containing protein [Deltaproteobacteria bacterium]|nr:CBS domain-containing protein [Deltaproteobacteria bacterium]